MRLIPVLSRALFLALLTGLPVLFGQPAASPVPSGVPTIGIIDYFGVRKASSERLRKALEVAEGDPLPKSKVAVEDRLELVPNVVRARLEAVCCENGKAILYVGVEEKGAPTFEYRDTPSGSMKLPEPVVDAYLAFFDLFQKAIRAGDTAEDMTQGHSLMGNAYVREKQIVFLALAKEHEGILRDVLRNSADEVERAMAAYVIAYVPKKATVLNDLQYALQDPDDGVRNNAMRSLIGFAILSEKQPELELRISPTWFIEQMNSLVWSDRNKAATALLSLTERRDEALLTALRERALDSVIDMARWRSLGHALPGFILLGRIAGVEEEKLQSTWSQGQHQPMVEALVKELHSRKK